jgi:hypothetical protein
MTATIKDSALRLSVLTALRDKIDEEVKLLRQDVEEELTDVHESVGLRALDVTLPDSDVPVASVSLKVGGKATVLDQAAFTKWVAAEYPTEIEQRVRSSFQRQFLGGLVVTTDTDGEVIAIDPKTGMIVDGVVASKGGGIVLRFTAHGIGREAIAAAWRAGELETAVPLILET